MNDPHFLAIILVNYNSSDYTLQCLESLKNSLFQNFYTFVVDNGSNEIELNKLKNTPYSFELIPLKENLGFTGGNNVAIQKALEQNFTYIMLLNNDTIVTPNFLSPMLDEIKFEKTAAVQSLIYYEHDRNKVWNAGGYFNKWLGITYSKKDVPTKVQKVDWITGCCFFIKSEIIRETGLLNDRYFLYFEDVEWSFRIKKKYELKIVPTSIIYHACGVSSKLKTKQNEGFLNPIVHFYNTRNLIYLLKSNNKGLTFVSSIAFNISKFLIMICYFIIRRRWKKVSAVCRGIYAGFSK